MITQFKTFESKEHDVPEEDDWILFKNLKDEVVRFSDEFCDFLENNIGQILSSRLSSSDIVYHIQYDKRFSSKNEFSISVEHKDIYKKLIWSSDRKKLERIFKEKQFDL